MTHRSLLLLGNTPAVESMTETWLGLTGGADARLVVLTYGGNWQKYVHLYNGPWTAQGALDITWIAPDEHGNLETGRTLGLIERATGIFVAGGDTARYHELYGPGLLGDLIRERYGQGVPYAGCSAGALLAMETCVLHPEDTGEEVPKYLPGLGLLPASLVGVHFSSWGGASTLLPVMQDLSVPTAWGVDDDACAYFRDEQFVCALGGRVTRITGDGTNDVIEPS